jgi:hypothetical protein
VFRFDNRGGTESRIESTYLGTPTSGTYLPITFHTSGSERMRLDTSGNLLVGTSGQIARLGVVNPTGGYGFAIQGQATDGQSILSSMDRSGTVYTGNITFPEDGSILFGRLNTGSQTTRMTIDSSGNVGIGGTADATDKVVIKGTLPSSSNSSVGYSLNATIPSSTTSIARLFQAYPSTQAASFTVATLQHYWAGQNVIGAGSTVTNQYGFYAENTLTGATNNYGFFSNIASGSNRWNFYANGTARNYFAGRTDVGNTRIEATNNWSGVKIYSETGVSVADGATVTLTNTVCGAVTINVYETTSGDGGTFFANYSGTVTKLAGDGAATDTGSTFAVYKSAGSHTLTLKNKYGNTRGFRVSVIGAYVE